MQDQGQHGPMRWVGEPPAGVESPLARSARADRALVAVVVACAAGCVVVAVGSRDGGGGDGGGGDGGGASGGAGALVDASAVMSWGAGSGAGRMAWEEGVFAAPLWPPAPPAPPPAPPPPAPPAPPPPQSVAPAAQPASARGESAPSRAGRAQDAAALHLIAIARPEGAPPRAFIYRAVDGVVASVGVGEVVGGTAERGGARAAAGRWVVVAIEPGAVVLVEGGEGGSGGGRGARLRLVLPDGEAPASGSAASGGSGR